MFEEYCFRNIGVIRFVYNLLQFKNLIVSINLFYFAIKVDHSLMDTFIVIDQNV